MNSTLELQYLNKYSFSDTCRYAYCTLIKNGFFGFPFNYFFLIHVHHANLQMLVYENISWFES